MKRRNFLVSAGLLLASPKILPAKSTKEKTAKDEIGEIDNIQITVSFETVQMFKHKTIHFYSKHCSFCHLPLSPHYCKNCTQAILILHTTNLEAIRYISDTPPFDELNISNIIKELHTQNGFGDRAQLNASKLLTLLSDDLQHLIIGNNKFTLQSPIKRQNV